MLQTSLPTFDHERSFRTRKSQALFCKNSKLITSGGTGAKTIHRLEKDLDKFTDERTLVVCTKGRMEGKDSAWRGNRVPGDDHAWLQNQSGPQTRTEHLLRPKRYSRPRRQQGMRRDTNSCFCGAWSSDHELGPERERLLSPGNWACAAEASSNLRGLALLGSPLCTRRPPSRTTPNAAALSSRFTLKAQIRFDFGNLGEEQTERNKTV